MEKIVDLLFARDVEGIEKLIKSKEFDVNSYIIQDRSALALSAACNYTDVMQCLITNGADVNLNNGGDLGYTPIEEAARDGSLDAIELLLKSDAEIDKGNTINSNALIGACISANNEVLEYLIKNGANINHCDDGDRTALHYICKFAKQWGSGVITETVDGVTRELENPRFKEHTIIFNTLLENGADVNLETNYGYTPLHLASETNTHSFIMPLIEKGAKVNALNIHGNTPLISACALGQNKCAKALLKAGADVDIKGGFQETALLKALHRLVETRESGWKTEGKNVGTYAKYTLEKGAFRYYISNKNPEKDPYKLGRVLSIKDQKECVSFFWGPKQHLPYVKTLETIITLLAADANVNTVNELGLSPMWVACTVGDAKVIKKLHKKGARFNPIKDDLFGATYLHKVAGSGRVDGLKMYLRLDKKCAINATDVNGWTPLHYLANEGGHISMAEMLIEKGGKKNIESIKVREETQAGTTASQVAFQSNNTELGDFLQ